MKHERQCVICGNTYQYCPNCSDYDKLPRWMFLFDNANCKKIYDIVNDYNSGAIKADVAKARLSKLDMSSRHMFVKGYRDIIDKIYREGGNVDENKQQQKFQPSVKM